MLQNYILQHGLLRSKSLNFVGKSMKIMGKKNKKRIGVVYSTNPDFTYQSASDEEQTTPPAAQQRLKVLIDRKKRKGKEVTLVVGFEGSETDLKALGKLLKTKCGVGGSVKDGEILIQGNQRDKVVQYLLDVGYSQTKKSGS